MARAAESRATIGHVRRILEKLFRRSITADFRRPVVNMFPELAQTYLSVIKEPMDLGSLLLRVHQGLDDVYEVRRCLQLIFSNAMAFNEGAHQMESISLHVSVYAKGLWEEGLNLPYEAEPSANSSSDNQFQLHRIESRNERFTFIGRHPLLHLELEEFQTCLQGMHVDPAFADVHSRILTLLSNALQSGESLAFPALLAPLFDEISQGNFDRIIGGSANKSTFPAFLREIGMTDASRLSDNALKFVMQIYDAMGEVLVDMCERTLRGSPASLIWSRGHGALWSVPPKSPCWPCTALAGFDVPDALAITNLSRIPEPIAKVLAKLKPKVATTLCFNSTSAFCVLSMPNTVLIPPEGYLLVEYFGSHDFGWVKAENTAPLTDDFLPPRTTPGKACSPESVAEVKDFVVWINASLSSDCEDYDVPMESASLQAFVSEVSVNPQSGVESMPVEETQTPVRAKRKLARHADKESSGKLPEYPPHSLYLSNNVVIPSFRPLPAGASKKEAALHRTRLLVAWANFSKPLGPHRGRSPFVEHATPDLSPALPTAAKATNLKSAPSSRASSGSKSSAVSKQTVAVKPSISHKAAALSSIVLPRPLKKKKALFGHDDPGKRLKMLDEDSYQRDDHPDDSSTVSLADNSYQREDKLPSVFTATSSSVASVAGEGIIHTNFIDLNSSIFFREHKNTNIRKKIISLELLRLKNALVTLRTEAASRMKDAMQSSERMVPILPRRVVVNPGRSGGVAVGNAKIGLARSFLEAEVRAAELWRSAELANNVPAFQSAELAL